MDLLSSPAVQLVLALIVGVVVGALIGRSGKGALESEVSSLQESSRKQKRELDDAKANAEKLESRLASLAAENSVKGQEAKAAADQQAAAEAQLAAMQEKAGMAVDEREALNAQLVQCLAGREALQAQVDALAAARQQLQAELGSRGEEVQELLAAIEGLRDENASLRKEAEFAHLTAPAHGAVRAASRMETPSRGPDVTRPRGEVKVISAEDALTDRDRALSDAYSQIASLRYSLSALTALSADLSQALEERNRGYDAVVNRVSTITTGEMVDLRDQIAVLRTALDNAITGNADLAAQLEERRQELTEIDGGLSGLLTDLQPYVVQAEPQLSDETPTGDGESAAPLALAEGPRARLIGLSAGVAVVLTALQERTGALSAADQRSTDLASQVEGLATEKQGVESALQEQQAALADAQGQVESLQASINSMTDQLDTMTVRMSTLEAELSQAHGELDGFSGEVAGLAARLQPWVVQVTEPAVQEAEAVEALVDAAAAEAGGPAPALAMETDAAGVSQVAGDVAPAQPAAVEPLTPAEQPAAVEAAQPDPRQTRQVQLAALAAGVDGAVSAIQQREETLAAVGAEVDSLHAQLSALSVDRDGLQAQIADKEQSLADARSQMTTLQATVSDLSAQIETLDTQASTLRAELDGALSAKAELEGDLKEAGAQLEVVNAQMDALQAQLQPLVGAVAAEPGAEELESGRTRAVGIAALSAGVAGAVATAKQRDEELAIAQTDLASLQEQLAALSSQKAAAEASVQQGEQALADAQAQVASLQTELDGVKAGQADAQEQLDQRAAELAAATTQLDALRAELGQRATDLASMETQVEALRVQLEPFVVSGAPAAEGEGAESVEGAEDATSEAVGQEGEAAANGKLAGMTALALGVAGAVRAVNLRDEELAATQAELATLQEQFDAVNGERADLEAAAAEMQQALAEQEAGISEAQSKLEDLTAEVSLLTAQVTGLQVDLDASQSAKADLEVQLAEASADLDAYNARMAELDEQLQPLLGDAVTPEEAGEAEGEPGRAGRLARLAVLSAGVAGAVQTVQERNQALDAAMVQAAELQAQIDALTEAKATMEAGLAERTQEMEALNAQLSEAQSSLEAVEAERASLQVRLESQEVELQDARQQLEAQQGQATVGEDEWEATRAQLESRAAEVTSLQGELDQATALFSVAPAVADVAKWFAELPPIKREAANAAIAEGVLPHRTQSVQKLSTVHGIGKVFEQRLYENGIGTYWEVAHLGGERVQSLFQLTDWQMMRLNMEEMRGDAYRLARETSTVGAIWEPIEVDDFEAIPGIGKVYERRLYEASIRTYADIAGATVEQLAEVCHAPEFRTPDYAAWIQRAKELVEQAAAETPSEQ